MEQMHPGKRRTSTLRMILGDQLSKEISSLQDADRKKDVILMCEVWEEVTYIRHHKKKIVFIFSAMRHFAQELRAYGFNVRYIHLDDTDNSGSLSGEISRAATELKPRSIVVTEPNEYRVLHYMQKWQENLRIPVDIRQDSRFLCTHDKFNIWAEGRKTFRMEYFYREMRRKYHFLMNGDEPEGGKWNYDSENRKPPKERLIVPAPFIAVPDEITREVLDLVDKRFSSHFGDIEPFYFAVTRNQAIQALELFITTRLSSFGDYQDAMMTGEPWMFHSHLSFYLNCGLLLPLECIRRAEEAYQQGHVPLNAAEGYIRQIMGWREYVRGIYWLKMPAYEKENFLNAKKKLPAMYWDGKTHMNCLAQCVKETKQNAYAHHIQRLMILGNFALIAGLDPDEVNEWYTIVYADAYQWVELPNVTGMILYADGGVLGSKPYAASGAYINKMSDYCQNCSYKVNTKNGAKACPFNYLYWDFLLRHSEKLKGNQRLSMIYKTLEKIEPSRIDAIKTDAQRFLKNLDDEQIF